MCAGAHRAECVYFRNQKRDVYNSNRVGHSRHNYQAGFGYAEDEAGLVNERSHRYRDRKFTGNQSQAFSPLSALPPALLFSLISSTARSLSPFRSLALLPSPSPPHSWLFTLSTLSIVFCIAHPQASVHYRKYWISIMKYWMISDIRRAADIVRSQYVLAFLAVPTSASHHGGREADGGKGGLLCLR